MVRVLLLSLRVGLAGRQLTPPEAWPGPVSRDDVDAVFRALPVIVLPGYSRPLVRVSAYLELPERSTYDGDRVR